MSHFIDATALPLRGHSGQLISDQRAQLIAERVATLDVAMTSGPEPLNYAEACEKFIDEVTRMGFWDRLVDLFQGGSQKRETLKAVARCHVATYPFGRRYLHNKGDYPVKVGNQSLHLLQRFTPAARASLLGPSPDRPPVVSGLSTIVVGIPGTPLRMPLLAQCFSAADGALSEYETDQLMAIESENGLTIRETMARKDSAVQEEQRLYVAVQDVVLGEAYFRGGCRDEAATAFYRAMEHYAKGRQYGAALRCLHLARGCQPSGKDSHLIAAPVVDAARACDLTGQYAISGALYEGVADIYAKAGRGAMADEFSARADERLERLGLRAEDVADVADDSAVATALEAVIRRNRGALSSTGLTAGVHTVFMDDMCDSISAAEFDAGEGERWCLMLRAARDGKRNYELITESTAKQLEARGMHPLRRDPLVSGDIVRSAAALELLVSCESP